MQGTLLFFFFLQSRPKSTSGRIRKKNQQPKKMGEMGLRFSLCPCRSVWLFFFLIDRSLRFLSRYLFFYSCWAKAYFEENRIDMAAMIEALKKRLGEKLKTILRCWWTPPSPPFFFPLSPPVTSWSIVQEGKKIFWSGTWLREERHLVFSKLFFVDVAVAVGYDRKSRGMWQIERGREKTNSTKVIVRSCLPLLTAEKNNGEWE